MSQQSPTTKGRRRDSTQSRQEAFQRAAEPEIQPPAHVQLRDGDLPFWGDIVRARAREVWTDVDLLHAANLTRTLADIERLQAELKAEGDVLTNAKGTQIGNPRHALLETLSRRGVALSRLLQLAPRDTQPSRERQDDAKHSEKAAAKAVAAADDDDLIPTHRLQ